MSTPMLMRMRAQRADESGSSLIEVLAAMFIIALASAVVVTSMPDAVDPEKTEALAFAAKLQRAADEAVISGLIIGVDVDADGYRFHQRAAGVWGALEDRRAFEEHMWSQAADVQVEVAGDRGNRRRLADVIAGDAPNPALRFSPTGEATPTQVWVTYPSADYVVRVGADGSVELEAIDAG